MTYVIHGATGSQGSPVAALLAASGESVLALTRNADAVVPGARVVTADHSSVEDLTRAYRDAEGVFVHLPVATEEDRHSHARAVVAAVRAARPGRVVFSTSGHARGAGSPAAALIDGLAGSGVSHAVVAPELFFENLLVPHVVAGAREQGLLRYPLPAGFAVSWASHLDVADVVGALFERPGVSGVVGVGQHPGVVGAELASAFGERFGREVGYEGVPPEDYFGALAPVLGEGPTAELVRDYRGMWSLPGRVIEPERSARALLGLTPRTTGEWLADLGV